MLFLMGIIIGGFIVAAYIYDREQDEQAPRDEYDDAPDVLPSISKVDKEKK